MAGSQTAFFPALEEFASKFLVVKPQPLPLSEQAQFPHKFLDVQKSLFEQLLLFDRLAIRVRGENVPLILLLRLFGERSVEELIDQDALRFVQWKPTVMHMVTEVKGVDALCFGDLKSAPFDDPEQSIDLGFKWLSSPLPDHVRKTIKRKVLPLYQTADSSIAKRATELTKSAYLSGKLRPFNLPPDHPYGEIPLPLRQRLNDCANEIADFSYLLDHGITSLSNYSYFTLMAETAEKLAASRNADQAFAELAKIEGVPDLKSLFGTIDRPFQQVTQLRGSGNSKRFRQWLAETNGGAGELTAEYIAAIADAKGPLDTTAGKFVKAIAMSAVSVGVIAAVGGVAGAALGAAAGAAMKVGEPVIDTGLDLLDAFVLDGLLKGWTPRMFFDDLRDLKHRDLRAQR